ncbi:hypothetical protein RND71_020925 [Anisodus tanguticus]|uniref:Uncharacterized protein n=1 Tax=Anisodus tanguticus TaxID=243964 RepID=A0AAE1RVL6_9SOLA|nr:hypothetical protein RND71_020925 [Anisodus tanguticus]
MIHISDIKLIRTDTTLDLSQKAEKVFINISTTLQLIHLFRGLMKRCVTIPIQSIENRSLTKEDEDSNPVSTHARAAAAAAVRAQVTGRGPWASSDRPPNYLIFTFWSLEFLKR